MITFGNRQHSFNEQHSLSTHSGHILHSAPFSKANTGKLSTGYCLGSLDQYGGEVTFLRAVQSWSEIGSGRVDFDTATL